MNVFTLFALGSLSLLPLSSHAVPLNDDFSLLLDVNLASDYRSRGISQTQNDPALQAGATLTHSSGLYLGAWSSNVNFGTGLKLRYGNMDFKDPTLYSNSGEAEDSYREWEVRLTYELAGVTLGLSYVDTNLSKSQCASNWGFDDVCSATVVASISKSF